MDAEGLYRDPLHAEGWFRDPYLVHKDRWFSDGLPTKLVRDGAVEGYDPPPPGLPKVDLMAAPRSEMGGRDPRRADDWIDPKPKWLRVLAPDRLISFFWRSDWENSR